MLMLSNLAKSDKLPQLWSGKGAFGAMIGLRIAAWCAMLKFLSEGI